MDDIAKADSGSVGGRESEDAPRITDMPVRLFDELAERLGCPGMDEETITLSYGTFRLRRLRKDHKLTGFPGAIGLQRKQDWDRSNTFVLWCRCPEAKDRDTICEPKSALKIQAGPQSGGVWAYGHGHLMREEAHAELAFSCGLDLESPAVDLIALILMRAGQLAKDPTCAKRAYWEGDGDKP